MDAKIKKIQAGTKKLAKQESSLLKMDKKQDRKIDKCEKMSMKKNMGKKK
jgi:hypothetical protein